MTELIPQQVDRHESTLQEHDGRMTRLEEDMYGDERARRPGLILLTQDTQSQMKRLIFVVWGLVFAITILAFTVAMAVLI